MKALKIVETDWNGNKYSWAARGKAEVKYKVGEFAEAPKFLADKGYGLLVFTEISDALYSVTDSDELWECEVEEELPLPSMLALGHLIGGEELIEIVDEWPVGSRMYKRVKLTKQLDPWAFREEQ